MAEFKVEIRGLEKIAKLADNFPVLAEKHINTSINRSLVAIWGKEKQEAPFGVSGQLRDRWTLQVGRFTGFLRSQMEYATAVQEGTKPHYVSPAALMQWATKKGLNAYAVAKSIAKKGTMANPFFTRAIDGANAQVQREFDTALKNIGEEITKAT